MATMRQIRNRIRVAGNIAQITGAMEMVAAARLKKAQDRLMAARPYVSALQEIVTELLQSWEQEEEARHPLAAERPRHPTGLFVITADRGLCGSYNSAIIRQTQETLAAEGPENVRLMVAGRRGRSFFRRRMIELHPLPVEEAGELGLVAAMETAEAFRRSFLAGEVNRVVVLYTRFVSPITQRPVVEQLLPIPWPNAEGTVRRDYLSEPDKVHLAAKLLPQYVTARLYYAMLESMASEHAARMTSMSAATDNAREMISSLTLALNRARQAAITKEISEIVSGTEALST